MKPEDQTLRCVACSEVEQGRKLDWGIGDQIGYRIPAVPVGDTFWGYSSVPAAGVAWWRALPTRTA
jgi:hypothetical protein